MTANRFYTPAYIGGKIIAVQMIVQNMSNSDITAESHNGIYYSYQGQDFQLLGCSGKEIEAGKTIQITQQLFDAPVPSSDIKLMVDTGGLEDCIINCQILWGIEE